MKTLAYYVSNTGFGHITRSLAIIEHILEASDYSIYLACGKDQIEYSKVFLSNYSGRVTYDVVTTEVGTEIKPYTFEFDQAKTILAIDDFLQTFNQTVDEEVKRLESMNVVEVITDISILGIHVAKKLGVRVVGVSNYTFYQRYKKMGIDQELTQPFLDAYNQLDVFYELAYADDMSEITCPKEKVGLAVRRVNRGSSNDFKTKFWPSCFLSIGQIANLGRINIDFQAGHVYATGNVEIDGNSHVVKLPRRIGHSQDYVAASSLAIIKPGWSAVAECLTSGVPFAVVDANAIEDGEITEKLIQEGRCFKVEPSELRNLDIKALNIKMHSLVHDPVPNDAKNIAQKIIGQGA
ncbi:hypothetical protein QBE53_15215 [Vallitaleaceae bacterium 9-2]